MIIRCRWDRHPCQTGGDIVVETSRRWVRIAGYFGEAPGSHMGLWHTDTGRVHGWNYRIGSIRRCLTLLAHTRLSEPPPEGRPG